MAEKDADVQKIKDLIKIMKENDLVKIDIKHGDDRISLRRAEPPHPAAMAGPILASLPGAVGPVSVSGAPPVATQIGSHVDPPTVVCIVEAMKVMNEIKAEVSGTIVEKRVANGQAVEYGQVLFKVKPE
jgi:acetyl-CoA carboxylase biotin carboxyl carrier protein